MATLGTIEDALFFPSVENEVKLSEIFKTCEKELHIAIFTFTNKLLASTILNLVQEKQIKVRIISDDVQASMPYSLVGVLQEASHKDIEIKVDDNKVALMHNKYVVIDGKTVITGSFNWTQMAVRQNSENVVILHGKEISQKYMDNFEFMWQKFADNKYLIKSEIKQKAIDFEQKYKDQAKIAKLRVKQSTYQKLKKKAEEKVTKKIMKKKEKSDISKKNKENDKKSKKKIARKNLIKKQKKNKNQDDDDDSDGDFIVSDSDDDEEEYSDDDFEGDGDYQPEKKKRSSKKIKKNKQKKQNSSSTLGSIMSKGLNALSFGFLCKNLPATNCPSNN